MSFCSAEPSCMCRDPVMTGTVLRTDRVFHAQQNRAGSQRQRELLCGRIIPSRQVYEEFLRVSSLWNSR